MLNRAGGVHLPLVSICALVYIYIYIYVYIYRSAIPLHLAVKCICFTIGLFILLSKDCIIRKKINLYESFHSHWSNSGCCCSCACCCIIHNNNNMQSKAEQKQQQQQVYLSAKVLSTSSQGIYAL